MITQGKAAPSDSKPSSDRFIPGKENRYPVYRRLSGPQGLSGRVRKISPSPGFDPRTVQSVGSRYTDYTTRPTTCLKSQLCSFITCNKMHFVTTFLHCIKLITAALHIHTAIQLSSLITQELLRQRFFSNCNVPPSVKKFRVLYRNSREIIRFKGAL